MIELAEIETRVKSLIADHLGRDLGEVQLPARIIEDLGADSLDVVQLLQRLEDEFKAVVDERDAIKMRTVDDVVTYIASLGVTPTNPCIAE